MYWVKNNMSLHYILNMRGNIYFVVFDKGSRSVAHEVLRTWVVVLTWLDKITQMEIHGEGRMKETNFVLVLYQRAELGQNIS